MCLAAVPANAADRWTEAAGGAVAILPQPSAAKGIVSGSLYCAEQKWAFLFRLEPGIAFTGDAVTIGLEGKATRLTASATDGGVQAALPREMLQPLQDGSRFKVDAGASLVATFSLRGSSDVIGAIAPRCSQIDMSAYEAVTLTDSGVAVDAARTLFADEIKMFRSATDREPSVAAVEVPLEGGRRLLFGTLCGSTWYYGKSGCTLSGWAAMDPSADWKQVYSTEGMRLYLDKAAGVDGWPGLATLPVVDGEEESHWVWDGEAYRIVGDVVAVDETVPAKANP